MSNEMKSPDDLRLPDELAACEARLAGQPLAAPRIDRDQLLYRAGWAAAEARTVALVSPPLKGGARGGMLAAWSLTIAAVAASLAVIITHAAMSRSRGSIASESAGSRPPLAVDAIKTSDSSRRQLGRDTSTAMYLDLDAIVAEASRANRRPPAALLAAYERQPASRWDEPIIVSHANDRPSEGAAEPATSAPLTARGWLDELLPTARRREPFPADNASPLEDPQTSRPRARGEQAI